jgi:hypothetical protein
MRQKQRTAREAGQAAQLYDEFQLRTNSLDMADPALAGWRNEPKSELVQILEDRFEDPEDVRFVYQALSDAWEAGRGGQP